MNKVILKSELFSGVTEEEASAMLHCLGAEEKHYKKDQVIYYAGQNIQRIGLLVVGSVNIIRTDIWGNADIIGHVEPGEVFGETYACIPKSNIAADVVAAKDASIIFMDVSKVIRTCASSCIHHEQLIRNILMILAVKNLGLTQKINSITPKTIRERVLVYLQQETEKKGSKEITIPFDRQQLADYLAVDRSALSKELSKMQKEGLILYKKSQFTWNE